MADSEDVDVRSVPLTQGFVALVDANDYAAVSVFNWSYSRRRNTGYAVRGFRADGRLHFIYLHRFLLSPHTFQVDHINGDGLDCRRSNMRPVTHLQNHRNRVRARSDPKTGVPGVHECRRKNGSSRFHAYICIGGARHTVGWFSNKDDAGVAAKAARDIEFIRLEATHAN